MVCTQHSETSKPRSLLILYSVGLKRRCRASLISSTEFFGASSSIRTSLQSIVCPSCQACSATADFSSCPRQAAARCSFILVSRVLLVSPIYTFPQLQGTLYTTPDFFSIGMGSFTLTRAVLRVLADLKAVLML